MKCFSPPIEMRTVSRRVPALSPMITDARIFLTDAQFLRGDFVDFFKRLAPAHSDCVIADIDFHEARGGSRLADRIPRQVCRDIDLRRSIRGTPSSTASSMVIALAFAIGRPFYFQNNYHDPFLHNVSQYCIRNLLSVTYNTKLILTLLYRTK